MKQMSHKGRSQYFMFYFYALFPSASYTLELRISRLFYANCRCELYIDKYDIRQLTLMFQGPALRHGQPLDLLLQWDGYKYTIYTQTYKQTYI